MKKYLTLDDVLLLPQFSNIKSRSEVDLSQFFCGMKLNLPIISSNMDTVTETDMAVAMSQNGAVGALHRFQSIEANVEMFNKSCTLFQFPIVSFGLGKHEFERALALSDAGADVLLLDIAHGACMEAVLQVKKLREKIKYKNIIVGNFASCRSIQDFKYHLGQELDAVKAGVGPGSACTTRVKTGCGAPLFSSVQDCVKSGVPIIADGGIRASGDAAKLLAAGAKMIMCGKLFAGTDESPGKVIWTQIGNYEVEPRYKNYRGSASAESYEVQGKTSSHRTPEGDSFLVHYVGPVAGVLQQIEAGIRSAMAYVGASTLEDFQERAEFIEISSAGIVENGSHGKSK